MLTLKEYAKTVNERLETIIADIDEKSNIEGQMPGLIAHSMRYSLLAGGKRLRPCMLLAAIDLLGGRWEEYVDFACSVEMIHSYSLIHDDLPGMDNDTMRRGRPTNHVVFGEGQAILAGDGLLNYAFENMLAWALEHKDIAYASLQAIAEIAAGAGVSGMIGGQVVDLECERGAVSDEKSLSYIHRNKTACMFIYPLRAAARLCNASEDIVNAFSVYGECFGRVFQITDDLLDVVGTQDNMGKTLGKDAEQGKLTAVSLFGIEGAREEAQRLIDQGMDALGSFGSEADFFRNLLISMKERTK